MAAIGNMGPFTPANFKASGAHNGVPTFVDKLPLTRGGLAGADAIFGRVVSIDPRNPRQFIKGIPTGMIPFGVLINEPIINAADPAMNDKYYEGRPATVISYGLFELVEYDTTLSTPTHGSKIVCNNTDGQIGFVGSATAVPTGYTQIPGAVYEVLTPNGVRIWVDFNQVTATSIVLSTVVTPAAVPAAGAVAAGTVVKITTTTPAAVIRFTLDGTQPTFDSPIFPAEGLAIMAATTIKAIGLLEGYNPSAVLTAAYTIA